jgi:hypothetical protein
MKKYIYPSTYYVVSIFIRVPKDGLQNDLLFR